MTASAAVLVGGTIEARLAAAGLPGLPRTAWLEIDLDRLAGNLALLRTALPPGVRIEPVVKADAYGHGALAVARTLEVAGADGLCVATLDEAIALRSAGIGLPISILFPIPPEAVTEAARRRLTITAGDATLLERTLAVARRTWADGTRRRVLRLIVEVETGLGRGGFEGADLGRAVAAIRSTPGVRLVGLWSHLAAPDDVLLSGRQCRRFETLVGELAGLTRGAARHLAASGAILAGTAPAFDVVRPGLLLYGIVPDGLAVDERLASLAGRLRPVMRLLARPVRVVDLPAGHGVGYGPTFVTGRPSRIATLPLGYGDGWARALSNQAVALVRGRRVPLVGTVAMDAIMADVTDVPGPPVGVDDEFVLIGEQNGERIDAVEVAQGRTTISWEVVTTMARRLTRVYYAGAGPIGIRTLTDEWYRWPESSSGAATSATSRSTRSSARPIRRSG
ncbi:MAG TPA: alanine racemase [Candidatus Binatia bacterium]|nr:alanine racemase [Candidatus Binatia bacterium]